MRLWGRNDSLRELLRRADSARQAGKWSEAVQHVDQALNAAESPEDAFRLTWLRLECLYFAGRRSLASRQLQHILNAGPPENLEHWCLALRLFPLDRNPQFALNTAVEGLRKYPDSSELMVHLERLCASTGRWEAGLPAFESIAAAVQSDGSYRTAARLLCVAGMQLRNETLARSGALRVLERPNLFTGRHEFLRAYAAAVLGMGAPSQADFADRLLTGVRRRQTEIRIHVASAYAALSTGDWHTFIAVTCVVDNSPEIPGGPGWRSAWSRLSEAADWMTCARLGSLQLASEGLKHRLRTGSAAAFELHAFALVSMALARSQERESGAAGEHLRDALGGWAALLAGEEALRQFAQSRFGSYGLKFDAAKIATMRGRVSDLLNREMERHPEAERLKLLWRLECSTVEQISGAGGLFLEGGGSIAAGPLLARALGLHKPLRLIEDNDLRLLYSPLGIAASLLQSHEFDAANREFERVSGSLDAHEWRLEDFQTLLIRCQLEASRELIRRTPANLALLRRGWEWALQAARVVGKESESAAGIAEIAMARTVVLFERRSPEQRALDADKRPLLARRREAVDLERLALDLAPAPRLRHVLAGHLNRYGVGLTESGDFDGGIDAFLGAVKLKPDFRDACQNLAFVLRKRRRKKLEEGQPEEAGRGMKEGIDQLRECDPEGGSSAVRAALEELAKLGPLPFLDRAKEALESGDWPLAVKLMCWAAVVGPGNPFVVDEGCWTLRELTIIVERGREELQPELERLRSCFEDCE